MLAISRHSLKSEKRTSENGYDRVARERDTGHTHSHTHMLTFALSIYRCEVNLLFNITEPRLALTIEAANRVEALCVFPALY